MSPAQEYWKPIPGFPDYAASNLGRIMRTTPRKGAVARRILKQRRARNGYLNLTIRNAGRYVHGCAHKLIALAFIGPCPNGKQVNHRDGNKENNQPDNLQYITHLENMRHAVATGLMHSGERSGARKHPSRYAKKLSEADIYTIRSSTESAKQLAMALGVSVVMICNIRARRSWAHVN